jgi:hypothetical protein
VKDVSEFHLVLNREDRPKTNLGLLLQVGNRHGVLDAQLGPAAFLVWVQRDGPGIWMTLTRRSSLRRRSQGELESAGGQVGLLSVDDIGQRYK